MSARFPVLRRLQTPARRQLVWPAALSLSPNVDVRLRPPPGPDPGSRRDHGPGHEPGTSRGTETGGAPGPGRAPGAGRTRGTGRKPGTSRSPGRRRECEPVLALTCRMEPGQAWAIADAVLSRTLAHGRPAAGAVVLDLGATPAIDDGVCTALLGLAVRLGESRTRLRVVTASGPAQQVLQAAGLPRGRPGAQIHPTLRSAILAVYAELPGPGVVSGPVRDALNAVAEPIEAPPPRQATASPEPGSQHRPASTAIPASQPSRPADHPPRRAGHQPLHPLRMARGQPGELWTGPGLIIRGRGTTHG